MFKYLSVVLFYAPLIAVFIHEGADLWCPYSVIIAITHGPLLSLNHFLFLYGTLVMPRSCNNAAITLILLMPSLLRVVLVIKRILPNMIDFLCCCDFTPSVPLIFVTLRLIVRLCGKMSCRFLMTDD